jgi:hypothetical protein
MEEEKADAPTPPSADLAPNDTDAASSGSPFEEAPPSRIGIKWPEDNSPTPEKPSNINGNDSSSSKTRTLWKFQMRGYDDDGDTYVLAERV